MMFDPYPKFPGRYWREIWRGDFKKHYIGRSLGDDDDEFLRFLEDHYQLTQDEIDQESDERKRESFGQSGIFTLALALITFGRIEFVDDVIRYMPPRERHFSLPFVRYAFSLSELLPVPSGIRVVDNIEGFRDWFYANKEQLVWNEDQYKFVFREDQ